MHLPEAIADRLRHDAQEPVLGRLGNALAAVHDVEAGPAYLKSARGEAASDLDREAARLRWIGDRLPVPDVLAHETVDGTTFLLLRALPGTPAHEWVDELGPRELLGHVGLTLRSIHALDGTDSPFPNLFDDELQMARDRLADGRVDRDAFRSEYGVRPEESLEWLAAHASLVQDVVFTHGDYCLPNVLFADGAVSGVVDWGIAGQADRHRDFMSVGVTLRLNGLTEYIDAFYEAYKPSVVDERRIRLYAVLDQFF